MNKNLMSQMETPQLTCLNYGTTSTLGGDFNYLVGGTTVSEYTDLGHLLGDQRSLHRAAQRFQQQYQQTQQPNADMSTPSRRIVKVYIADPHPDVPMDAALIHEGEEKFTDATDQELFFEIGIKDKLEQHNKKRITWADKEASKRAGKDIFLEPVKIRELRMVVVTVAQF